VRDSSGVDIVLVISNLGLGGAQRVVTMLAAAWAARGFKVQIATFCGREQDHFRVPDNVERVVMGDPGESRSALQGIENLTQLMKRSIPKIKDCHFL